MAPHIEAKSMTTLTIIIPVFNRARVIGRAIESVLAQDIPPGWSFNILVVDDGSSDNLAGTLNRFGAEVIHIRHDRNLGAAAARNTGIASAAGEYVAFLD